jgi:hypothetical protein
LLKLITGRRIRKAEPARRYNIHRVVY